MPDSQVIWTVVGTGVQATGSSSSIPSGALGVGDYTLRVVADDGFDQSEDSIDFSVSECTGSCPVAAIISPGQVVIATSTRDEEGRVYADIDFEGFATDAEDGELAGRFNDGLMTWTTINARGESSSICTPFFVSPPLVQVEREIRCDAFTTRFYLDETTAGGTQYVVTMEVTDSDGNRASDSVMVTLRFDLI
jgi:hypothetical protein